MSIQSFKLVSDMTLFINQINIVVILSLFYLALHGGFVKADNDNIARLGKLIFGSNDDVADDSFLDTVGLLTKYNYPIEVHTVQTVDGYILALHRIPNRKNDVNNKARFPVLILHGLWTSSSSWVADGPGRSFAYILSDAGFDVWLGNFRGNCYSRNHVTLDPDNSDKYWDFGIKELVTVDTPEMIDYVLSKTGLPSLHIVGHSQGAMCIILMLSMRPEYNDKIIAHTFAPTYYMYQQSPFGIRVQENLEILEKLECLFNLREVFPKTSMFPMAVNVLFKISPSIVSERYMDYQSLNDKQIDLKRVPIYWSHTFGGSGYKLLVNILQMLRTKYPLLYDYGPRGNMDHYGSGIPPGFNLSAVTAPVYIHYAKTDTITHYTDVLRLHKELVNSKGMYRVKADYFSHINFIYGLNTTAALYRKVINLMRKH